MAYSISNPPQLVSSLIAGKNQKWYYESADAIADVDATDYFTNAADLGMKNGASITIYDNVNDLVTVGKVLLDADGTATATAFTAFP